MAALPGDRPSVRPSPLLEYQAHSTALVAGQRNFPVASRERDPAVLEAGRDPAQIRGLHAGRDENSAPLAVRQARTGLASRKKLRAQNPDSTTCRMEAKSIRLFVDSRVL